MADTRTGFTSRERRGFLQKAISITASTQPLSVARVRKRLRYCWSLQDAIATAAPTS